MSDYSTRINQECEEHFNLSASECAAISSIVASESWDSFVEMIRALKGFSVEGSFVAGKPLDQRAYDQNFGKVIGMNLILDRAVEIRSVFNDLLTEETKNDRRS
jgi:hypothetical protein